MALSGDIAPGLRLQQVPLSESLGVSRTPLREALGQLASQGLVIYEPNRGYSVRAFSVVDVQAAFQIRARLEGLGASLCASRGASPDALARLRACVIEGDRILSKGALEPDDLAPYRRMNVDFHETIIEASGNPLLRDSIRQCHNAPLASDRVFVWEDFEIIARSHDDHRRVLDAIIERDAPRADYLMREHIYFASRVLLAKIDRDMSNLSLVRAA